MQQKLTSRIGLGTSEFSTGASEGEAEDDEDNNQGKEPCSRKNQQRLELFQAYEVQRNELSLYDCLHAPGPSIFEGVPTAPRDQDTRTPRLETTTEKLRRFQKACTGFEEALQKFHNLQSLYVRFLESDKSVEVDWDAGTLECEYRDFYGLNKEQAFSEETTPLAFILRALGKRNASNSSLTSLRLELAGDCWWGLQDLEYAWMPPEVGYHKENLS